MKQSITTWEKKTADMLTVKTEGTESTTPPS